MATETGENKYKKYGQPTLDLVFTGEKKSLTDRVGNKTVEFTRSSTATYVEGGVVKYASQDQARFEKEGLLIEESRTNLMTYSEDIGQGQVGSNVTKVLNIAVAPNGTSTADSIVETTATNVHGFSPLNMQFTSGTVYTCSFYFKAASGSTRYPQIAFANASRCSLTSTATGTVTTGGFFSLSNISNGTRAQSYTGDGVSGILLWGAQLEEGSFPTSYIPTTSSTVTRAADIAQITGDNFSSWYNQSEGTFTVDLQTPLVSVNNSDYIFSANDGSTGDNVAFRYVTYSTRWFACGSQIEASPQSNDAVTGKYSMAWDSSTIGVALDGISASVASGTVLTTATTLNIFTGGAGSRPVYGTLARLSFYPTRLTDSQLQALTL
jgi:hypothetical protein